MADLLPEPPVGYQPTSIVRVTLVADETTCYLIRGTPSGSRRVAVV